MGIITRVLSISKSFRGDTDLCLDKALVLNETGRSNLGHPMSNCQDTEKKEGTWRDEVLKTMNFNFKILHHTNIKNESTSELYLYLKIKWKRRKGKREGKRRAEKDWERDGMGEGERERAKCEDRDKDREREAKERDSVEDQVSKGHLLKCHICHFKMN